MVRHYGGVTMFGAVGGIRKSLKGYSVSFLFEHVLAIFLLKYLDIRYKSLAHE